MFTIKSTRLMEWPGHGFTLRKGDNEFPSRRAVPAVLWPKLERFRKLKLLDFQGAAAVGESEPQPKLADLKQVQLYAMSKEDLAELAKREGVTAKSGKKSDMLEALVPGCKNPKPATDADEKPADEQEVELTAEGLERLNLDELRQAAEQCEVDIDGLTTKRQVLDRMLAWLAASDDEPTTAP